jgi:hypothetical protein
MSNISIPGLLKFAIETHFEDFITYFSPKLAENLDFTVPPVFLERELHAFFPVPKEERQAVKIIKIHLKDQNKTPAVIYIGIQGQVDPNFSGRMFYYYNQIRDKYYPKVTCLAILLDSQQSFYPNCYEETYYGYGVTFQYPVYKVLNKSLEAFAASADNNIFSIIIWVARLRLEKERKSVKLERILEVLEKLYQLNYSIEKIKWLLFFTLHYFRLNDNNFVRDLGKLIAAMYPQLEEFNFVEELYNWDWQYGYQEGSAIAKVLVKKRAVLRALQLKIIKEKDISEIFDLPLSFVRQYKDTLNQQPASDDNP